MSVDQDAGHEKEVVEGWASCPLWAKLLPSTTIGGAAKIVSPLVAALSGALVAAASPLAVVPWSCASARRINEGVVMLIS
jgi:hypothetical protein